MLVGAPVLLAQLGVHDVRRLLKEGDDTALTGWNMADRGSAKQFVDRLSKAPPLEVLKLLDYKGYLNISRGLAQVAESLDYAQRLTNIVGDKPALNPVMNAVSEAFSRRRISGSFGDQSVKIDTLLHSSTQGPNDDDVKVAGNASRTKAGKAGASRTGQICFLFQSNKCTYWNCRYRHVCNFCESSTHGMMSCTKRSPTDRGNTTTQARTPAEEYARRPPHPRRRRDRAHSGL